MFDVREDGQVLADWCIEHARLGLSHRSAIDWMSGRNPFIPPGFPHILRSLTRLSRDHSVPEGIRRMAGRVRAHLS